MANLSETGGSLDGSNAPQTAWQQGDTGTEHIGAYCATGFRARPDALTVQDHGYKVLQQGQPIFLRTIVMEAQIMAMGGRDDTEGSTEAPSLRLDYWGGLRLPLYLKDGSRTVKVKVKQPINRTPRPRAVIEATPAMGIAADVSATAADGTGWIQLTLNVTVTTEGACWFRLENRVADAQYSPCYWDAIEIT